MQTSSMPRRLLLPSSRTVCIALFGLFTAQTVISVILRFSHLPPSLLAGLSLASPVNPPTQHQSASCDATNSVIPDWHEPEQWSVNNLDAVVNGTGTFGFRFDSTHDPLGADNWCNMPHVNTLTYSPVDAEYELRYVEVIHRHHKRTPYAANGFPVEAYPWDCNDQGLFYSGKPLNPPGNGSAATFWNVFNSPSNPMRSGGFEGTCQFPQITRGGLDDSYRHGADLKAVYHNKLGFIPAEYDPDVVSYRVTNNVITSQVASMIIAGMWPDQNNVETPLLIQPSSIDSLEPSYKCPHAASLSSSYGPGSSSPAWLRHIDAAASLKTRLDAISGVDPDSKEWSKSFDHYFDNLSSRLCHDKPLPCNVENPSECIRQADADEVFRLGEYEYSFIYRDSAESLPASVASYGIWIAEVALNLRHAMGEDASSSEPLGSSVRYRHNVAHDGSIARLLSILQIDKMVWPGMGAEVVFEMFRKENCYFVRVLWGGEVMRSSHPTLGLLDLVPVSTVLAYFDNLAGTLGEKIPGLCSQ